MERDLGVWAKDEDEASDKACEIVEGWDNVMDAEATDCEEDESA